MEARAERSICVREHLMHAMQVHARSEGPGRGQPAGVGEAAVPGAGQEVLAPQGRPLPSSRASSFVDPCLYVPDWSDPHLVGVATMTIFVVLCRGGGTAWFLLSATG